MVESAPDRLSDPEEGEPVAVGVGELGNNGTNQLAEERASGEDLGLSHLVETRRESGCRLGWTRSGRSRSID